MYRISGDRLAELVFLYTLPPPPLQQFSRQELGLLVLRLRLLVLKRRLAIQAEKLANSPELKQAREFSRVLAGVSDEDIREIAEEHDPAERRRRIMELKQRDPEKWRFLFTRPFFEVHPRAYEAITQPNHVLRLKAQKLTLNLRRVTRESLARELKISVTTLYDRYGRDAVRQACQGRPFRDEVPVEVCYQVNG
jgi:hypothetical protein